MYTIKRAAELTGVAPATLRAWERRYGLGKPLRTESGYRLYDERALADIRAMQRLLDDGWAPKQAASEVLDRNIRSVVADPAAPAMRPEIAGFLDAARAMDEVRLRGLLDEAFGQASFEAVVDQCLAPTLRAVGEAWAEGTMEIAAEHFVSAAVMRRLSQAFEAAPFVRSGPMVLVGLPEGSFHEIGALAFATAARRAGIRAIYLGANLPLDSWLQAVESEPVAAVVVSVVADHEVPTTRALFDALAAAHPHILVASGGPRAGEVGGTGLHLDNGLATSVDQLLQALAQRSDR